MEFDEYLIGKKIDPKKFQEGDRKQYEKFKLLFDQMHPNSFTQQKLFLINRVRRSFQLIEVEESEGIKKTEREVAKPPRPKLKPLKINPQKPKLGK